MRIARDFYEGQSCARADVLTPGLVWTGLCGQPPHLFHGRIVARGRSEAGAREFLLDLAEELVRRA